MVILAVRYGKSRASSFDEGTTYRAGTTGSRWSVGRHAECVLPAAFCGPVALSDLPVKYQSRLLTEVPKLLLLHVIPLDITPAPSGHPASLQKVGGKHFERFWKESCTWMVSKSAYGCILGVSPASRQNPQRSYRAGNRKSHLSEEVKSLASRAFLELLKKVKSAASSTCETQ